MKEKSFSLNSLARIKCDGKSAYSLSSISDFVL